MAIWLSEHAFAASSGSVVQPELQIIEGSGKNDESELNKHKSNELPLTQVAESQDKEGDDDNDDVVMIDTTEPAPDINAFLNGISERKAAVVDTLHWLMTTTFIGSISLYLETVELKKKAL